MSPYSKYICAAFQHVFVYTWFWPDLTNNFQSICPFAVLTSLFSCATSFHYSKCYRSPSKLKSAYRKLYFLLPALTFYTNLKNLGSNSLTTADLNSIVLILPYTIFLTGPFSWFIFNLRPHCEPQRFSLKVRKGLVSWSDEQNAF